MKSKNVSQKIICLNRKASFNYYFKELYEAGIVLKGSEVKSLRNGKGSIADSYAVDNNGELYLINSHIPYSPFVDHYGPIRPLRPWLPATSRSMDHHDGSPLPAARHERNHPVHE